MEAADIIRHNTTEKEAADINFTRAIAGKDEFDASGRYSGMWGKVKRRANPENFESSRLRISETEKTANTLDHDLFVRRL